MTPEMVASGSEDFVSNPGEDKRRSCFLHCAKSFLHARLKPLTIRRQRPNHEVIYMDKNDADDACIAHDPVGVQLACSTLGVYEEATAANAGDRLSGSPPDGGSARSVCGARAAGGVTICCDEAAPPRLSASMRAK